MKPYICRKDDCPSTPFFAGTVYNGIELTGSDLVETATPGLALPVTVLPFDSANKSIMPNCPHCNSSQDVHKGAVTHLIIKDATGPLQTGSGAYRYGCAIAQRLHDQKIGPRSISHVFDAVTCFQCLKDNAKPNESIDE